MINVSRVPFVVRLYTDARGTGFCGGSLLDETTVLTAAHCVHTYLPTYVGTYQNDIFANATASDDPLSDVVRVVDVAVHPRYDPNDVTRGNDVAVLTLQRPPLRYGAADGPTSVPLANASFWPRLAADQPSDAAYVVGYGASTYGGPQSLYLRTAHVHLYSHAECVAYLGLHLSASNLCAGLPDADSCSGDSGGPLVVAYDGLLVQVGIVSWGVGECGDAPGVYSLASAAYDVLAPRGARYVEYVPSPASGDACACADDCVSNGFSVAPRCGCDDHAGDGMPFCYVHHEDCTNATHSVLFFGALYRDCTPPPSASPTSAPIPSLPSSLSPPPVPLPPSPFPVPPPPSPHPVPHHPPPLLQTPPPPIVVAVLVALPVAIVCLVIARGVRRTRGAGRPSSWRSGTAASLPRSRRGRSTTPRGETAPGA